MWQKVSKSKLVLPLSVFFTLLITVAIPLSIIQNRESEIGNAHAASSQLYVSPAGSDNNTGTDPGAPLKTIQAALNRVTPGTTINLAMGIYHESITTMVDGTADNPIIIK